MCNDLEKTSKMAEALPLMTLHGMILNHSQFLRIMLSGAEVEKTEKVAQDSKVKGDLNVSLFIPCHVLHFLSITHSLIVSQVFALS